jgi:hypothetical protein
MVALGLIASSLPVSAGEPFRFVAIGDLPYGKSEVVNPKFEALIGAINLAKPAFTIHIGDTKSGNTPCSNEMLDRQRAYMDSFDSALVYTPGDNEWTDCHRKESGSMDPLDRLAYIRTTYFPEAKSRGKVAIALERQSDLSREHKTFVENARFLKNDVMVVTAHVVGSNNNFEVRDPKAAMEFFPRDAANIAWLAAAFEKAKSSQAKAVVLAIHADMFEFDFNMLRKEEFLRHSGFLNFGNALVDQANAFGKPVLLVYGDSHIFRVWRPFPKRAPGITALEVYGASDMHAVEVTVTPDAQFPFAFRPLLNPQP